MNYFSERIVHHAVPYDIKRFFLWVKKENLKTPSVELTACALTYFFTAHWYLLWLAVVTLAYIYNCVSIILRAAFKLYYTKQNQHIWFALDYTCDLIYLLDLILVKPRVQFIKSGLLQVKQNFNFQYIYFCWSF